MRYLFSSLHELTIPTCTTWTTVARIFLCITTVYTYRTESSQCGTTTQMIHTHMQLHVHVAIYYYFMHVYMYTWHVLYTDHWYWHFTYINCIVRKAVSDYPIVTVVSAAGDGGGDGDGGGGVAGGGGAAAGDYTRRSSLTQAHTQVRYSHDTYWRTSHNRHFYTTTTSMLISAHTPLRY